MTDDHNPTAPDSHEPPEPVPATSNGHSPAATASVRSGLAHRRNPALVRAGEIAQTVRRIVLRDPLSLFLLLASIGLAITFALLLGQIKPGSSGRQVPISTVQKFAKSHGIASATLLDHDSRVVLETTGTETVLKPKVSKKTGGTRAVTVTVGPP